jgi:hypothetical protein
MAPPSPQELILTDRDVQILLAVYLYDGLTVAQIRRRFWAPPGGRSASFARVGRLAAAGYLRAVRLPPTSWCGSGQLFVTAGPAARAVLGPLLEFSPAELTRVSRAGAPAIVAHHLAVSDFRLSLEMAAERLPVREPPEWLPERVLARAPITILDLGAERGSPEHRSIRIVPDGCFTLITEQGELTAYLEMDMGTIPLRLRGKLRAYLLHERTLDAPRPILFVTSDSRRQATIAAWAASEAQAVGDDPTVFLLTTRERVDEGTVLRAPIWQVVGGPAAQALLPAAGGAG